MQKTRLENWTTFNLMGERLHGNVYDHPKFEDGDTVTTSPIVKRFKNGKVKTLNTVYILGSPAPKAVGHAS